MLIECHIHSCDYTCLHVFSHAQSLLINHKKIFECFSCFWKVFCFYKNCQKFKNYIALLGDSVASRTSLMSQLRVHHRDSSRRTSNSLAGNYFNHEKDSEYFSNFGFSCFSRLRLATCSRVEGPFAKGTQRFSRLSSRLSREWNFQLRKTLRIFFLSFLFSVLAADPGDLHSTCLSRENRMFWANLVSFKPFQFSLEHF